jgi:hypothetical protein
VILKRWKIRNARDTRILASTSMSDSSSGIAPSVDYVPAHKASSANIWKMKTTMKWQMGWDLNPDNPHQTRGSSTPKPPGVHRTTLCTIPSSSECGCVALGGMQALEPRPDARPTQHSQPISGALYTLYYSHTNIEFTRSSF